MKRVVLLLSAAAVMAGGAPAAAAPENHVQVVVNVPVDALPAGEWTPTNVWGYLHDGNPFSVEPVSDGRVMPLADTSSTADTATPASAALDPVVPTVGYDQYMARMESHDKKTTRTLRAISKSLGADNAAGFRNNYRLLIRQYDDIIRWLKNANADPCWEGERTKAIRMLTAERNKFNQSFRATQAGRWSVALSALKQAFKLRSRTIDWYNDSYAWSCD